MNVIAAIRKTLLPALLLFLALTALLGFVYPVIVTLLAQWFFPAQAGGSLIREAGGTAGSVLLAHAWPDSIYFQPRPSASGYATIPSGASNLSPADHRLRDLVRERRARWAALGGCAPDAVPADLVFASGSGLDPDLSPEAALFQVDIVARHRRFTHEQRRALNLLVQRGIRRPPWYIPGPPTVNVQRLNRDLDARFGRPAVPDAGTR